MIRELITEYAYLVIALLVITFIIIKFVVIRIYGLKEEPLNVFMISLRILGRPVIDNTYFDQLQKYYKLSNRINKLFYGVIVFIAFLFLVTKMYL